MKNFVFTISLILCTSFLFSQTMKEDKPTHYAGLNAGITTGVGLTYRYWKSDIGFQVTATPIKTSKNWSDLTGIKSFYSSNYPGVYEDRTFISIGATGFYKLKQYNNSRIFSYLGNHLFIRDNYQIYNIGAGLGISFEHRVGVSLMLGYQGFDVTDRFNLLPTVEISLMYKITRD